MEFDKDLAARQEARELARQAKLAQERLAEYSQEQLDTIVRAVADAFVKEAVSLAEEAVQETGFGNIRDKTAKNRFAAEKVLSAVKDKIVCVRGNCEAEVDQMVLPFPCLADYALFPYVYGDENGEKFSDLFLTHGHLYSAENPPLLNAGDVLFNGHFHVPCHKRLENGAYYLNCGSVSLPKENSPHSFVLLQGGRFVWIDLATGKPFDEFSL